MSVELAGNKVAYGNGNENVVKFHTERYCVRDEIGILLLTCEGSFVRPHAITVFIPTLSKLVDSENF